MLPAADLEPAALCSDPRHLPLVDAAFERPGGPAGYELRNKLCRRCPIASACLDWAMTNPEHGVWGGTSPHSRTRHGAPHKQNATAA